MDEFDPVQYYEYRRKGIHFQEELFGKAFVYVGGRELTAKICKNTSLSPGQKVSKHETNAAHRITYQDSVSDPQNI